MIVCRPVRISGADQVKPVAFGVTDPKDANAERNCQPGAAVIAYERSLPAGFSTVAIVVKIVARFA